METPKEEPKQCDICKMYPRLEGQMQFISRCLDDITFGEAYKLLKEGSEE